MSIKTKFFLSSVIMLVLPIFLILLISAFILMLIVSFIPNISIEINGMTPTLTNPVLRKYIMLWILILIVVVSVCCVGVTTYLSRSILNPLKKIADAMEHLTEGDLDYEFICTGDAEIKEVYDSMERLRIRLKQSVSDEINREAQHKMLIANISHDLKTPITSIKGYVEGIKDGVAVNPEMMKRYLDTIEAKADTLEKMVNNLSLHSKLNFESIPYDMQVLDICEFVDSVINEYSIDLKNGNMEVSTGGIINDRAFVRFDKSKMKRVFANIIENSIKYKKPGEPGRLAVDISRSDRFIVISFSDRGIGISRQDESKVFKTFFRADPARNLNISGNGLGLSICDRIVKDHGGHMWMRSNVDSAGVTVYIRLMEQA